MKYSFYITALFCTLFSYSQAEIEWLTFEDLEAKQIENPKKVFLYFYADWCVYCKKMEKGTFKNSENIKLINDNYYAVKLNVETSEIIKFKDTIFKNNDLGNSRKPIHDIVKYFISNAKEYFALPAIIILKQNYTIETSYFSYLSPKQLNNLLTYYKP